VKTKLSTDRPTKLTTDRCSAQQWRRQANVAMLTPPCWSTRGCTPFQLLKLRSYWTKVHRIFTRCSQVFAVEPFEIGIAIFHSVLECQGERWVGRFWRFWS